MVPVRLKTLALLFALLALFACHAGPAASQPPFFGINGRPDPNFQLSESVDIKDLPNEAARQLDQIEALERNEKWDEAVETLRRLAETYGSYVLQLTDRRYINVRDYCQIRLAAFPAEAIQLYRDRVDLVAKDWYENGLASRDQRQLRRVVDQLFCSSFGDDALLALGEIALEQGNYGEARWFWERVSPLLRMASGRPLWYELDHASLDEEWPSIRAELEHRDEPATWLAYPDSDLDLASIRARLVLVSVMEGATERATLELDVLNHLNPEAEGYLAGKSGNYVATLKELLAASLEWPVKAGSTNWTTFAGSPTRSVNSPIDISIGMTPTWAIDLRNIIPRNTNTRRSPIRPGGPDHDLAVHPLVVGNLVLFCGRDQVFAYSLADGTPAFRAGSGQIYPGGDSDDVRRVANPNRSALSEPRYTMSVSGDRLFARLGSQVTVRQPNAFSPRFEGNRLVCLSLAREGSLLWKYPLEQDEVEFEQEQWAFEGPPICDGDRVFVAMRRSQSPPEAYVACFDIQKFENRVEKVSLKWRRRICSADTPGHGQLNELTHNLLTLAEGKLYYNTNLGAVAALSADDGTLLWAYSYPRAVSGKLYDAPPHFYRDLNPCIYHEGLVIAAPTDCASIVALDAATGQLVWWAPSQSEHPIHLLGVGGGNLIATGSSVWWIDAVNGKLRAIWPEKGNGGAVRGYGRGLLADGNIYWPTHEEIFVFDQRIYLEGGRRDVALKQRFRLNQDQLNEGDEDRPLVTGGNLVVADHKLLIATDDYLLAFDLLNELPPIAKVKEEP